MIDTCIGTLYSRCSSASPFKSSGVDVTANLGVIDGMMSGFYKKSKSTKILVAV